MCFVDLEKVMPWHLLWEALYCTTTWYLGLYFYIHVCAYREISSFMVFVQNYLRWVLDSSRYFIHSYFVVFMDRILWWLTMVTCPRRELDIISVICRSFMRPFKHGDTSLTLLSLVEPQFPRVPHDKATFGFPGFFATWLTPSTPVPSAHCKHMDSPIGLFLITLTCILFPIMPGPIKRLD